MKDISSILFARMKLSMVVNGLLVSLTQVPDSLSRFCRPLLFHQDENVYDLAYSGSSLMFRTADRNFVISTAHQYRSGQSLSYPDTCIIYQKEGRWVGVSPREVSKVIVEDYYDQTAGDLVVSEYDSSQDGRNIDLLFLQLDILSVETFETVRSEDVRLIFAIGYASQHSDLEPILDGEWNPVAVNVVNRWSKLYFEKYQLGSQSDKRISIQLDGKYHPSQIGNPDGFSGSPVFFVWEDGTKQLHLGFAGIITQGHSNGEFLVYSARQISEVLRKILSS